MTLLPFCMVLLMLHSAEECIAFGRYKRQVLGCSVYERAFTSLRESQPDAKEEAVMLLEAWRNAEAQAESVSEEARAAAVQAVEKRMPKRIKRKVPSCLFLIHLSTYALPLLPSTCPCSCGSVSVTVGGSSVRAL